MWSSCRLPKRATRSPRLSPHRTPVRSCRTAAVVSQGNAEPVLYGATHERASMRASQGGQQMDTSEQQLYDPTTDATYERAGWGGAVTRGPRPALVVIDLTRGFTEPEFDAGA